MDVICITWLGGRRQINSKGKFAEGKNKSDRRRQERNKLVEVLPPKGRNLVNVSAGIND